MLRECALPVFAALAVAAVVIAGAGAVAQPAPMPGLELSNRAAVAKYLASHGITTKRFVVQRGARNYAGPSCPGKGWTCTTSKRVVQISFGPNVTQFTCTASSGGYSSPPNDCLIVQ